MTNSNKEKSLWHMIYQENQFSNVLLFQNNIEIMRARIMFHEAIKPKKVLFNFTFFTIDQWQKKTISSLIQYKDSVNNPLVEKILLAQLLEEFAVDENSTFKKIPGFAAELYRFWQLYNYFGKDENIFNDESTIDNEIFSLVKKIFFRMENICNEKKIYPVSKLYHEKNFDFANNDIRKIKVWYFFPSTLTEIDKIKLSLIRKVVPADWSLILLEGWLNRSTYEYLQTWSPFPTVIDVNHDFIVNTFESENQMKKNFQKNYLFNKVDFIEKIEVIRCEGALSQARYSAEKIIEILHRGTDPSDIMLLYSDKRELLMTAFYLKENQIEVDSPDIYPSTGSGILFTFYNLLQLIRQIKTGGCVGIKEFTGLLQNYYFLRATKYDENIDILQKWLKKDYIGFEQIPVDDFLRYLHSFFKIKAGHKDHLKLLKEIIEFSKKCNMVSTFTEYSQKAENLLNHIFSEEIDYTDAEQREIKQINTLFSFISGCDSYSNQSSLDTWLGHISSELQIIIDRSVIKPDSFHENEAGKKERRLTIYARDIQEGLHLPVSYLVVTGLTSEKFPVHFSGSYFLTNEEIARKYHFHLNYTEQIKRFETSLGLVKSGVFLTFSLDSDPSPSEIIFEIFKNTGNENNGDKDEILKNIPVYIEEKSHLKTAYPVGLMNNHILNILKTKVEEGSDSNKYNSFLGLINSEKKNYFAQSASGIEKIAQCPQSYLFSRIFKMESIENNHENLYYSNKNKGLIFHEAASSLMNYFIENFDKTDFNTLAQNNHFSDKLIEDCIVHSVQKVQNIYKGNLNLLLDSSLLEIKEVFISWFSNFRKNCEKQKDTFAWHYPVITEFYFENLKFSNYTLKGIIDRVDYSKKDNLVTIIDYKTGKSWNNTAMADKIEQMSAIQIIIYMKAVCSNQDCFNIPWNKETKIQGVYLFPMEDNSKKQHLFVSENDRVQFSIDEALNIESIFNLDEKLDYLFTLQKEGFYFAAGHKKNNNFSEDWIEPCSYCEYRKICDATPFFAMNKRMENMTIMQIYKNLFMK